MSDLAPQYEVRTKDTCTLPGREKWRPSASSLLVKSGIAFLDQALLSVVNFFISILLIRTVSTEEYGYYSISFAVSLLFISIQNAVVTTPLAVLLASKGDEEKQSYVASLYRGQLITVLGVTGFSLIASIPFFLLGFNHIKVLTSASLCFAALGILLREFSRAYYFAEESPLHVLKLDVWYAVTYLGLIVLAYFYFHITVPLVFVFMGASGILSSIIFSDRHKGKATWLTIRASYRENWQFARWSLLGIFVTHIQSYCNLYLLGIMLNSSAAGNVSASRLPLMPLALVQAGWSKVALPRGARLRENQNVRRFLNEQIAVSLALAVGIAIYVCFLLASSDLLQKFIFVEGYENALDFIVFWGAIQVASYAALNASLVLQVTKNFSVIAKVNCITMVITVCSSYYFIRSYGIQGSLTASLLGETLFAAVLWWVVGQRYVVRTTLPSQRD